MSLWGASETQERNAVACACAVQFIRMQIIIMFLMILARSFSLLFSPLNLTLVECTFQSTDRDYWHFCCCFMFYLREIVGTLAAHDGNRKCKNPIGQRNFVDVRPVRHFRRELSIKDYILRMQHRI